MAIDYDIEALKEGVQKCKKNIKTFENAIQGEHDTIADYRNMIEVLETKQKLAEGITVDADVIN